MGILTRLREIMASNMQALVDKAEQPEEAIRTYMRSVQSDLGQVKAEMAALLAEERRAQLAIDECRAEIRKLQRYAEKSLEAGRDAEARSFLERKAALAEKEAALLAAFEQASANARDIRRLNEKLAADLCELEAGFAKLQTRLAATKAQQALNSLDQADSLYEKARERVNQEYDEAMALKELRSERHPDQRKEGG